MLGRWVGKKASGVAYSRRTKLVPYFLLGLKQTSVHSIGIDKGILIFIEIPLLFLKVPHLHLSQ